MTRYASPTYTETIWTTERLKAWRCGKCGIWFGMPEQYIEDRRRDGKSWCCPNGHSRYFTETTEMRLRHQLEQQEATSVDAWNELIAERKAHSATKGKLTKTKNRISKGVCPCCSRSFAQLAQHMKSQHPDFVDEPQELGASHD